MNCTDNPELKSLIPLFKVGGGLGVKPPKINFETASSTGGQVTTVDSGDPIIAADPLFGIWCAVNRKTRAGLLLGPRERITPMEGIRAYTINGAYASFEENLKGSIEPGKLADFAVLEENPCEVDPWHIRDIRVQRTIIGGETVYQAA